MSSSDETFQSRDIERHPESYVGKTVTMAGKDPICWERTTITGYEAGKLLLSGGALFNRISGVRRRIANDWVYPWDIARGVVHSTGADDYDPEADFAATGSVLCADCGTRVRPQTLSSLPPHRCLERQAEQQQTTVGQT